jgi:hypothetical protein
MTHKEAKQLILLGGQLDSAAVDSDVMSGLKQLDRAAGEGMLIAVTMIPCAEEGARLRQEFARLEGFGEINVTAQAYSWGI